MTGDTICFTCSWPVLPVATTPNPTVRYCYFGGNHPLCRVCKVDIMRPDDLYQCRNCIREAVLDSRDF